MSHMGAETPNDSNIYNMRLIIFVDISIFLPLQLRARALEVSLTNAVVPPCRENTPGAFISNTQMAKAKNVPESVLKKQKRQEEWALANAMHGVEPYVTMGILT
nr:MAR-binding filament-like protein 1-1 [Ipomoea batatas]